MTMGLRAGFIPLRCATAENMLVRSGANPYQVFHVVRGRLTAFACVCFPADRLLAVSGCRALRIHSPKMAVDGHRTSYHPGLSSFHFRPGMGPPLVNVQLEGGVAYMRAMAGVFHLPQIWIRCSGMDGDCS